MYLTFPYSSSGVVGIGEEKYLSIISIIIFKESLFYCTKQ